VIRLRDTSSDSQFATLAVTDGGVLTNQVTGLIDTEGASNNTQTIAADVINQGTITVAPLNLAFSGQLSALASEIGVVNGDAGLTLSVAGLDVDGMTVDNVRLISTGGTITRFDNVTFGTFATDARQLTINHPGDSTYTFNNLTFNTTPTTGFHISANDTDGGTPLTIQMANPNPATGIVEELNGAVIVWPSP
jgi:hypothetical protein